MLIYKKKVPHFFMLLAHYVTNVSYRKKAIGTF